MLNKIVERLPEQSKERAIQEVSFVIVSKNEQVQHDVMELLHEYPKNFVHGLFEQYAEQDLQIRMLS